MWLISDCTLYLKRVTYNVYRRAHQKKRFALHVTRGTFRWYNECCEEIIIIFIIFIWMTQNVPNVDRLLEK
jgi:hypothetical protein